MITRTYPFPLVRHNLKTETKTKKERRKKIVKIIKPKRNQEILSYQS